MIQRYLEDPLLYKGRKFDIRIFVLAVSDQKKDGLKVFVFRGGLARLSQYKYNKDSKDLKVHLTNTCFQRQESSIDIEKLHIDIFDMEGINARKILSDIESIVQKLFEVELNPKDYKSSFELFGLDFILDKDQRPLLLEVNSNPGLGQESLSSKKIKNKMLDRTLEIIYKNRLYETLPISSKDYEFNQVL